MNLRIALLTAALPLFAAAFTPQVSLTVTPDDIVLTESAEAELQIVTPRPFRRNPTIAADFIPQDARLSMERDRVSFDGTNTAWRYVVKIPFTPDIPGVRTLGPVTVSVPTRTDFFGFVSQTADYRSDTVTLKVVAPPDRDVPKSYCGAISRNLEVSASLDANVCTAGDPLIFTLEIGGATDFSMVYAPPVKGALPSGSPFRLDQASLKTETLDASKRFTWRIRALKAGTVEFPSIDVSYFDIASRTYRTVRTEPIPVQVKAGEQAVLGMAEAMDDDDAFPMPDGLEIPFAVRNFTLKHALSLAFRAETEADFAAAAERYAAFVDAVDARPADGVEDGADFMATHLSNLGALYIMAGRPKEALAAYRRAEWTSGATAATMRGIKAAVARIRNDPRAELPLPRLMFPFWFRLSLWGRIALAVFGAIGMAALFVLALKAGRRLSVLAFAVGVAGVAQAWPFGGRSPFSGMFDEMSSMRMNIGGDVSPIKADAIFMSTTAMAGEPVDLEVTVDPGSVRIEQGSLRIGSPNLPDGCIAGGLRGDSRNVYRMRITFLEPATNRLKIAVSGAYSGTYCVTNGNMISSGRVMNQPFKVVVETSDIVVTPLPEDGRPADFSGAIGNTFRLSQRLTPNRVHPGDLVTAEYRLDFDGYCPSNAEVRVEGMPAGFKAYDVKETARDAKSVTWSQVLVPLTAAATNSAQISFSYYSLRSKRYERVRSGPAGLVFVSSEAASTENTKVMVDAAGNKVGKTQPVVLALRFAPSAKSPVVLTLPPGTEVRETGRLDGWRRVESADGAGWIKE